MKKVETNANDTGNKDEAARLDIPKVSKAEEIDYSHSSRPKGNYLNFTQQRKASKKGPYDAAAIEALKGLSVTRNPSARYDADSSVSDQPKEPDSQGISFSSSS